MLLQAENKTAIFKLLLAAVAGAALAVLFMSYRQAHSEPALSAEYHAVALDNGQVYFGRIDRLDGDYTILRDVFYVQARQNPTTNQVANVLVKRGGEAHGPDRMILNRQHLVLIEPVGPQSQLAKLIAEQNQAK